MDKLRVSVQDEADGGVCPAVGDESGGVVPRGPELADDVQDRRGLVVEGLCRTPGIVPVETGQRHRDGAGLVGCQVFQHFIPRPGAQPVAGDENDDGTACSSCHANSLAAALDKGVSLFMS